MHQKPPRDRNYIQIAPEEVRVGDWQKYVPPRSEDQIRRGIWSQRIVIRFATKFSPEIARTVNLKPQYATIEEIQGDLLKIANQEWVYRIPASGEVSYWREVEFSPEQVDPN